MRRGAIVLVLAGCAPLVVLPEGRFSVTPDPDLARFSSAEIGGEGVEPFPVFGGLVVGREDGPPLGPADRSLADRVLTAHCGGTVPADIAFRDGVWSSAPCG